jgi:PAS domain S-box-containing protein
LSPPDLYRGQEKEKVEQHIKEVLKSGYTELEAWLTTKNNGEVPLYFTASTIQYKGERCIFGTGTDISKRLHLLHELELLISNTDEAFMYVDQQLNVVSYNHQMKTHYDLLFNKKLKKGLKLTQLAKKGLDKELNTIIKQVWKKQHAKAILKVSIDGEKRYYELKFKPILSEDNKVNGIFITSLNVTERIKIERELKEGKERLELVMKAGSESIWDYDVVKGELFLGEGYRKKYGLSSSGKLNNIELHDSLVHQDDFKAFKSSILNALADPKITEWTENYRFRKKGGDYARVEDRAVILRDEKGKAIRAVGAIKDVSHQYLRDKLDEIEKSLMENSIKAEKSIQKLLHDYLSGIDSLFHGMKTSVTSIEKNRLKNFNSPNLPIEYLEEIENLPIGLNQGSCGTAAYLKQQVVVKNILNDERWEGYTDLAIKYNFKSCWSEPIFNNKGSVIATFAVYNDSVKSPEDLEINIFERAARLISLILQNFTYIKSIQESNERFKYINKATNNAIYDWKIGDDHFHWGNSLTRVFGHKINEDSFSLRDWAKWIHTDDKDEVLQNLDMFLANPEESKWSYEYRFKDANGQYAYVEEIGYLLRDEKGQPVRMIGALRDQTQNKQDQLKQELQYELSQFFKKEESLNKVLRESIKYLSQFGGYQAGEIWLMSHDQQELYLSAFYAKSGDKAIFYDQNTKKSFQLGEGLPGTVWKSLKNEVWNEIDKNTSFIRQKLADEALLKSASAYPLFYQEKIIGVMVLFSDEKLNSYDHKVMFYNNLKHYLGAEIIRKQQEEELNLFFNSAPEILAIATSDGKFAKVNPAFSKLLGYSQEELTSKPFSEFIHPDDLKGTMSEYNDSLEKNRITNNFINRYITKSGVHKWISWSSSHVFGEEEFFFAFGRDVTETIELQQTVENATRLARVGGWEINHITGEHYWSPMTREIHEVPEDFTPNLEEAISFYHPDYQQIVSQAVERAINNGESFDFEAIIISYKGNEKWVRAKGNAEFVNGQCVRLYGSFQDIHDRKRTELRLENISNNVPGVIFQYHLKTDGTDLLDFVSKGSEEIFGYSPEVCMQDTEIIWNRIEAGGDMSQMKNSIMESAQYLTSWHFIWRYQHPNGLLRYHEGSGNPHKLADGTVVWDSIITDITELRELEILADRTAELAKIGSWELNLANGKSTDNMYWSPMTRKILGVDNNYNPTLTGGFEFYLKESQQKIKDAVEKLINKGTQFDLELLIRTSKDKEKWVRCIGQADRVKGETKRIFGSFQDIDLQKRTELAVQEGLKEKEDILESIGDAFFAVDNEWTVTYWNKEAEKILFKKKKEILFKNLWEEYKEAIPLKFYEEYHKAMKTQKTVEFEEYFPPLGKWFEVSAYPSAKGLSVYFKDITLRKTADEKIKASNERFEKVAMATNDAIWDWDLLTNKTTRSGTGFENQFGYKAEKADKDPKFWANHVHPEDLERITKSQERAIKDKKCNFWKENYRFKKKSDGYAYVVDKGFIVRDEKGKAVRIIGATTDVTERKNYEKSLLDINEQLQKQTHDLQISNAELEQFAYVASHDLQEPLRMISGFLTQLEKKYGNKLDEKAHQYIDFAVDGANRMRQIILDLLDFSRIGKEESELVDVDLNEVVDEVCMLHRKKIDELNAKILFKDLPTIMGHPSPIIQLFQNLISNSLKYTDSKTPPKIVIKSKELKREWKFSIEDNGIGIDKAYYDKIFNIFQRLHNKSEYSGTGMGLAIVKKIIEKLNGKIWLESELGKGTTFYFTIPK